MKQSRKWAGIAYAMSVVLSGGPVAAQSIRDTVRVQQEQAALNSEMPSPGAALPSSVRTIAWAQLIPAGWDPYKDLKALYLSGLQDNDPKADEALKKIRQMWDNAPINPVLLGQNVRLPGFMVPLEDLPEGSKEFLLVPYFGACVHSPPPPANQIVHVVLDKPTKRFRLMDTLWVTGALSTAKTTSHMGVASYRIDAKLVVPFVLNKK